MKETKNPQIEDEVQALEIRELQEQDIPAVARIAQDVYVESFGEEMEPDELEQALKTRDEEYFQNCKNIVLIAVFEDNIAGFIEFGEPLYDPDSIKPTPINFDKEEDLALNKIYLDDKFRGKGIAKALMAAMEDHPEAQNKKKIYLDVYSKNVRAVSVYSKNGYEEVGNIPFIVDGVEVGRDILMKKAL